MKNNRTLKIGFLIFIGLISIKSIKKWGFNGHRKINRMAVFTLPNEMSGFFKKNLEFITANSTTPDSRRYSNKEEGAGHYIDIEYYVNVQELEKKNWNEINKIIPKDSLYKHGILPWRIIQYKFLLQKAFEQKSYREILKYASELGHYIADAHVPLHTTKNYNGQYTNQLGIHSLWETKIVDLIQNDINYFTEKAYYVEDIEKFIWDIINKSHTEIPIVLIKEKNLSDSILYPKYKFKSNNEKVSYTDKFISDYNLKMNELVSEKIKESIIHLGSIWYTAWIDAGQPILEIKQFKQNIPKEHHECE
jgi:hypothetical protein